MVTGMRGLCNGLGPAMFGIIFYMFHVDLNEGDENAGQATDLPEFESYSQVNIYLLTFLCAVKMST